jgi:methylmalonyl-CoA/ethylmalonyl-CoA epimerase
MPFSVSRIGQVAIGVSNVDRSETFYRDVLGLRKLFRFGDLAFFDCGGVRLLIEKASEVGGLQRGSTIYFSCLDISLGVRELEGRGVRFLGPVHLIAPMEDHDLWMTFFTDPDGHILALMMEAPKGYQPNAAG